MPAAAPFTLRPAVPSDAPAMVIYCQAMYAEGNPYLPGAPGEFKTTIDEERALIAKTNASGNGVYLLAFAGPHLVAIASLTGGARASARHNALFGLSVHKDHRSQGIGTAMLAWLLAWARQSGVIRRVELFVYADNAPAIHLYRKFGFTDEGTRRQAFLRNNQYIDDNLMALLLNQ